MITVTENKLDILKKKISKIKLEIEKEYHISILLG